MYVRGEDIRQRGLFSYGSLEERVPANHPLRPIRTMVDEALKHLLRALLLQMLRASAWISTAGYLGHMATENRNGLAADVRMTGGNRIGRAQENSEPRFGLSYYWLVAVRLISTILAGNRYITENEPKWTVCSTALNVTSGVARIRGYARP